MAALYIWQPCKVVCVAALYKSCMCGSLVGVPALESVVCVVALYVSPPFTCGSLQLECMILFILHLPLYGTIGTRLNSHANSCFLSTVQ